jgi:MOSC domain-containing protein YiiM
MFGENLTVSGMDESKIKIGDIYKVGEAIVQVSQPRQPCNKFAAKFRSNNLIRQFIDFDHPGVYLRVIHSGHVVSGDELQLDLRNEKALSVRQIFQLLYSKKTMVDKQLAEEALYDSNLSKSAKDEIQRHWKV